MKKILLWIGIVLLLLVILVLAFALPGKKDALSLQIENVDLLQIEDGTYTGTYDCLRFTNSVAVTVMNHQITGISILKTQNGREEIDQQLIDEILAAQTPALDAISGATADKNAFLKAVETALQNGLS